MNNEKKFDAVSFAVFFPAIIALAVIPVLMRVTCVITDLKQTYDIFGGTEKEDGYYLIDVFSQCKAYAAVVAAIAMIAVAVGGCMFIFRHADKRNLFIVGASGVYLAMALISACLSKYPSIAFNGEYDRAEGFYTTACYMIMLLFSMYVFRKEQNFRPAIYALFFCVAINAVLGVFQFTGNSLMNNDWFNAVITDPAYRGEIVAKENYGRTVYGALYHYNYVGSFAGMLVPLFTTLAIFDKKLGFRICCAVADLLCLFMLFGSTARSGVVAVAAAAVVGIIVFAKVIAKHWKISLSAVAAAAVVLVGANAAMDGALLKRVPSIFTDVIEFIMPAKEGETLFDNVPVKEIKELSNGDLVFVAQTDELRISFDTAELTYRMYDKSGAEVPYVRAEDGKCTIKDERYTGIELELYSSEETLNMYQDFLFFTMPGNKNESLLFRLMGEKSIRHINANTGTREPIVNAEAIGFEGKEKVGSARGYIWSRTFPLLKKCLAVGYGADTFAYFFPQTDYLAKFYCYDGNFYMTVDKVHDLYLQQFFSHGLIALIAMLFIFVWYLVDCFRLYALRKEYRTEQIFGASVMLAVVGYLAAGFFNDSVVSVAPIFWILLGIGFALNTINRRADRGEVVDLDDSDSLARKMTKQEKQFMEQAEERSEEIIRKLHSDQAVSENAPKNTPKAERKPIDPQEAKALFEKIANMTPVKETEDAEDKETEKGGEDE